MTVRHEWVTVSEGGVSVELVRQSEIADDFDHPDEVDPDDWALFIGHPDGIALLGTLDELGLFLTGAAFAIARRKAER